MRCTVVVFITLQIKWQHKLLTVITCKTYLLCDNKVNIIRSFSFLAYLLDERSVIIQTAGSSAEHSQVIFQDIPFQNPAHRISISKTISWCWPSVTRGHTREGSQETRLSDKPLVLQKKWRPFIPRETVCPHIPQDDAQCCIHHLLSSQSATSVNNTNNSSTCIMNAVTAAVNPCNASKESVSNVDWCFGQNPSDRSVWLFPVSNTQSRFLLAVPRGDGLRWSSGGTLRSCEEPEPHWAIAGAQQPSTCCPQPT